MALWHADIDAQAPAAGARLHVFSDHQVVRVLTADQLSIETPAGQRLAALVLDRTGDRLTLSLFDGASISLSIIADSSLSKQPEKEFSGQLWIVN